MKACFETQQGMLEHQEMTAEMRHHVSSCAECRQFEKMLGAIEAPCPSAELDRAVASAVKSEMRRRRALRHVSRMMVWAAGVAAALVVTLAVWNRHLDEIEQWGEQIDVSALLMERKMTPVDPLLLSWTAADQAMNEVEFQMGYSASMLTPRVDSSVQTFQWSSTHFKNVSDQIESLEETLFDEASIVF